MPIVHFSPVLTLVFAAVLQWVLVGIAGLIAPQNLFWVSRILFPLGVIGGAMLAFAGAMALPLDPSVAVLPIGLPDLPFHVRVDALSAIFLILLGVVAMGISIFSPEASRCLPAAKITPSSLMIKAPSMVENSLMVSLSFGSRMFRSSSG